VRLKFADAENMGEEAEKGGEQNVFRLGGEECGNAQNWRAPGQCRNSPFVVQRNDFI
jgi:hypothetical protein